MLTRRTPSNRRLLAGAAIMIGLMVVLVAIAIVAMPNGIVRTVTLVGVCAICIHGVIDCLLKVRVRWPGT